MHITFTAINKRQKLGVIVIQLSMSVRRGAIKQRSLRVTALA